MLEVKEILTDDQRPSEAHALLLPYPLGTQPANRPCNVAGLNATNHNVRGTQVR